MQSASQQVLRTDKALARAVVHRPMKTMPSYARDTRALLVGQCVARHHVRGHWLDTRRCWSCSWRGGSGQETYLN